LQGCQRRRLAEPRARRAALAAPQHPRGLLPSPAMRRIANRCGIAGALAAACALAAGCGKVQGAADAPMAPDDSGGPDAALSWSPFAPVAVNYTDQVRVPVPSGDGLTLYFLAQLSTTDLFDIYSASRASTGDSFGVATALLNVN